MRLNKIVKYFLDSGYRFLVNSDLGAYHNMDDEIFLKKKFKLTIGYDLDLNNPTTYNEKLQWLKLYDRQPLYTTMVDKYAAKKYVADIIGEEYIIPTLGVWDKFEDIDFSTLPDKFVLKCTHDSGGLVICRDKKRLDINAAARKIKRCLKNNYFWLGREWPYKNVKPRIIAEQLLEENNDNSTSSETRINDYKIYAFNGTAKIMMVNQDRGSNTKADYFDEHFNYLDFTWGYSHSEKKPQKPIHFELMVDLASRLSQGIPEVRVDFYEVDGKVYFGELTFFDGSGFDKIEPFEWDQKLGSYIELPAID